MTKWVVRDRQAGNVLSEEFESRQEAETELRYYEQLDTAEGIYEEDFYEVYPVEE